MLRIFRGPRLSHRFARETRIGASLLDLIGDTPLVELPRLSPRPEVRLYAKLEVPSEGVKCDVTPEELAKNLDRKK